MADGFQPYMMDISLHTATQQKLVDWASQTLQGGDMADGRRTIRHIPIFCVAVLFARFFSGKAVCGRDASFFRNPVFPPLPRQGGGWQQGIILCSRQPPSPPTCLPTPCQWSTKLPCLVCTLHLFFPFAPCPSGRSPHFPFCTFLTCVKKA